MRLALAGVVLVGVLALTACGSSVSLTPVAKAADKTVSKGSEHIEFTGSATVSGQAVSMSGHGDFQNDPQLGAMSLTMNASGKHIAMDEVMKGWTVYMRSPLFANALPAGKSWMSLDLEKSGKQLGIDFSQFAQSSPSSALDALKQAGSVTEVGSETIDGEQTTHYRATIDISKVPNGQQLQKLSHLSSLPVDVWIGSDGLLRRLKESFTQTVSGQSTSTAMTMSFSKYGEPVNVQVPTAGQTVDMTKLGG